jgi:O-antigen/teichoic acid export membrane protein
MHEKSVFRGALLTVSVRWIDRLIGLLSMVILARLLAPEDFGLIAMAMLVLGLVDIFLDLGVNVALIQNSNATQDHYNTAWTLRLIQSALTTALLYILAPFAANYFNDIRIEPVLQYLAFAPLLRGFENIGIVTFQKEMRFGHDFYFTFIKRIIGFVATITSAWFLQSYWALVAGALIGTAGTVLLSYMLHPMRPRISLIKVREILNVSQWMILNAIGSYASGNLHKLVVGRRESAEVMGAYVVANEIAVMPSTELLAPLNRVLFHSFVNVKDNLH